MELKDLTKEQGIKIVKLAFNYDFIQSLDEEFKFKYIEQDLETPECIQLFFNAFTFGNNIEKIRLTIYNNLNLSLNIIREYTSVIVGITNQYKIFEKFVEWNIEPKQFTKKNTK